MTLGEKIKKARADSGLTQKELADQLSVTFQTVSKWEGGVTEPDLSTLRRLSQILDMSLEYLVSDEETPSKVEETPVSVEVAQAKKQIATCCKCHKKIFQGEEVHVEQRDLEAGGKQVVRLCDACYKKERMDARAEEIEQSLVKKPAEQKKGLFHKITSREDKKPLIWGIVLGVVALGAILVVCILNYSTFGIGWTIALPILLGYATCATIYCLFTASYISEVFVTVAGWSVHFPGLIFTWDLDGIMWLIGMKILFFVLGIMISLATFLLALALSALLSIFSFVPLLIYNKTHY